MHLNLQIFYSTTSTVLRKDTNQALQLAKYAIKFLDKGNPSAKVLERTKLFHTDTFICGMSALAYRASQATLFRSEAQGYSLGRVPKVQHARVFGSTDNQMVEKAVAANITAVSEWNSCGVYTGTYGRRWSQSNLYPAVVAAAHSSQRISGSLVLKAMVLHDEIRCKLSEACPWGQFKINGSINGALATICVFGALVGASPQHIESAIGMYVSHYSPWLVERLADCQAYADALSNEAALICVKRAMRGFVGPRDIFRNPESLYRHLPQTAGESPLELVLENEGDNFSVMKSHFRLGSYGMDTASAVEALLGLVHKTKFPCLIPSGDINSIEVRTGSYLYNKLIQQQPKNLANRQSAMHSLKFVLCSVLKKAYETKSLKNKLESYRSVDELWRLLMLAPHEYAQTAINHKKVKLLMSKCTFVLQTQYDGLEDQPVSVKVTFKNGEVYQSEAVSKPAGHSENKAAKLEYLLAQKNKIYGRLVFPEHEVLQSKLLLMNSLERASNKDLLSIYSDRIPMRKYGIDHQDFEDPTQ